MLIDLIASLSSHFFLAALHRALRSSLYGGACVLLGVPELLRDLFLSFSIASDGVLALFRTVLLSLPIRDATKL